MISALKEAKNELVFVKFYAEYLIYEMVLGTREPFNRLWTQIGG